MKRAWHPDELAEQWTILPEEQQWIGNKYGSTRLGFVVFLKFFQHEGHFPRQPAEVPRGIVEYLAQQVDVGPETWEEARPRQCEAGVDAVGVCSGYMIMVSTT